MVFAKIMLSDINFIHSQKALPFWFNSWIPDQLLRNTEIPKNRFAVHCNITLSIIGICLFSPTVIINTKIKFKHFFTSFSSYFYLENGEFIIATNSVYQTLWHTTSNIYSTLTLSLTLDRRLTYYLLNMILPCAVFSMLISLAFCLPVLSGERISLQITVILSFSIYQMMLAGYIPNNDTKIPILNMWQWFDLITCKTLHKLDLQYYQAYKG